MFSKSFLRHCSSSPPPPPPRGIITTNIVGGLGNQLFLLANLLATANRNNLVPYLPIQELNESSSVFEPRPTYWNSPLFSSTLLPTLHQSAAEALIAYLIENNKINPETGDFSALESSEIRDQMMVESVSSSSSNNNNNNTNKLNGKVIPELGADANHIIISDEELGKVKHFNLVGFFQSDRYFDDFTSSIVPILQPPNLAKEAKKSLEKGIFGENAEQQQHVIGLHVRRGDYLKLKHTFEILDADGYYFEALEKLFGTMLFSRKFSFSSSSITTKNTSDSSSSSFFGAQSGCHSPLFRVLIFSEDVEFAKMLRGALEVKYPTVQASIVVGADYGKQQQQKEQGEIAMNNNNNKSSSSSPFISFPDFESGVAGVPQDVKELLLMAQCDDLIMANSSFSWWAGYFGQFNDSKRRVVAPQKWFTGKSFVDQVHIYGKDWIVV